MKFTIGRKLGIGFGSPLLLLAVIGFGATLAYTMLTSATADSIHAQEIIGSIERGTRLLLTERIVLSHQLSTDEVLTDTDIREAFFQQWAIVVENTSTQYSDLIVEIQRAVTIYHQYLDKTKAAVGANPDDISDALLNLDEADVFFIQILEPAMADLRSVSVVEQARLVDVMENQTLTIMRIAIIVVILGIILGIASAYAISRGLTSTALYLSSAAESISRGDLDSTISVDTGDELEDLGRSIERMRVSLKAAIERLRKRT